MLVFGAGSAACFIFTPILSPLLSSKHTLHLTLQALLLLFGISLTGIWIGGQEHAEDLYLHNSVDKTLINSTCRLVTIARRLAMTVGALLGMLMLTSAVSWPPATAAGSLTKAFSGLLILAVLAITMMVSLLFKEVTI